MASGLRWRQAERDTARVLNQANNIGKVVAPDASISPDTNIVEQQQLPAITPCTTTTTKRQLRKSTRILMKKKQKQEKLGEVSLISSDEPAMMSEPIRRSVRKKSSSLQSSGKSKRKMCLKRKTRTKRKRMTKKSTKEPCSVDEGVVINKTAGTGLVGRDRDVLHRHGWTKDELHHGRTLLPPQRPCKQRVVMEPMITRSGYDPRQKGDQSLGSLRKLGDDIPSSKIRREQPNMFASRKKPTNEEERLVPASVVASPSGFDLLGEKEKKDGQFAKLKDHHEEEVFLTKSRCADVSVPPTPHPSPQRSVHNSTTDDEPWMSFDELEEASEMEREDSVIVVPNLMMEQDEYDDATMAMKQGYDHQVGDDEDSIFADDECIIPKDSPTRYEEHYEVGEEEDQPRSTRNRSLHATNNDEEYRMVRDFTNDLGLLTRKQAGGKVTHQDEMTIPPYQQRQRRRRQGRQTERERGMVVQQQQPPRARRSGDNQQHPPEGKYEFEEKRETIIDESCQNKAKRTSQLWWYTLTIHLDRWCRRESSKWHVHFTNLQSVKREVVPKIIEYFHPRATYHKQLRLVKGGRLQLERSKPNQA